MKQSSFRERKYSLVSNIPAKHKFATKDLTAGSQVMMYGVLVGKTSKPVRRGELAEPQQYSPRGSGVSRKVRRIQMDPARRRPLEGA